MKEVGEGHAPQQCGQRRTPEDGTVPPHAPRGIVPLPAHFKGHSAKDERGQYQEESEVEATEDRRVPQGEGGECGATRGEQPDFIAVPHWPDGVDHHPSVHVVVAEERQQNPDAKVEALQEEVAQPEHRDKDEPELLQPARWR